MKFKIFRSGGYSNTGISTEGGQSNGPLIMFGDPVAPLQTSTKRYVDNRYDNLNASDFASGVIPTNKLPILGGDIITEEGSNVISLKNTGVIAGTYTKVNVNSKGLVTNVASLTESDIPNLSFIKLAIGRPSSLDGYGILDGVNVNGDTMTGSLTINGVATVSNDLINKSYLDSAIGNIVSTDRTGNTIRTTESSTPDGYLRCNGAELSKITFSALYAVIGDNFTSPTNPNTFRIPDLSSLEVSGTFIYIKT